MAAIVRSDTKQNTYWILHGTKLVYFYLFIYLFFQSSSSFVKSITKCKTWQDLLITLQLSLRLPLVQLAPLLRRNNPENILAICRPLNSFTNKKCKKKLSPPPLLLPVPVPLPLPQHPQNLLALLMPVPRRRVTERHLRSQRRVQEKEKGAKASAAEKKKTSNVEKKKASKVEPEAETKAPKVVQKASKVETIVPEVVQKASKVETQAIQK
jgi:hypothetical protein